VDNTGISSWDNVYLGCNSLSDTSLNTYIPELESRGIQVYSTCDEYQ